MHHTLAYIEGNHLPPAHITGGVGNPNDHGNAQSLADYRSMALAAVLFGDHPG
jgi:hypothetical protein